MSILEILEAHQLNSRHLLCACGDDVSPVDGADWLMDEVYSLHRAHQAQVLEQHEREAKAEALEEAAANLARESDQFATTAERLAGHDNTRYHAYSAARQSIAHQLRDRAAQLKENI